jgi:ElaB/YqjD/DUF883 family membrane-anchored ribosome-binding protein
MKNADSTIDTVSDFAHGVVDKATKATNMAVDTISVKGTELKISEQRLMKEAGDYIRDNPVTSVGIAIGVGFLLSKFLNNR